MKTAVVAVTASTLLAAVCGEQGAGAAHSPTTSAVAMADPTPAPDPWGVDTPEGYWCTGDPEFACDVESDSPQWLGAGHWEDTGHTNWCPDREPGEPTRCLPVTISAAPGTQADQPSASPIWMGAQR